MNQSETRSGSFALIATIAVGIIVAASVLVYRSSEQPVDNPTETTDVAPADPQNDAPVWEAWPKPAVALLLTGEQHGYFEPCGCTANQLGGMARRADLFEKLTTSGWDVIGMDIGGLSRRTAQQAAIKLNTTLSALHQLNYAAVGLGTEELQLGVDRLLEVHMNMSNSERTVPFISANLSFLDGVLEGFPQKSRVVETGGLKIGVTSVLSEELKPEVFPVPDTEWTDPEAAITDVLKDFEEQGTDINILLSQSTIKESEHWAELFPAFDVILTARGIGDPDPAADPQKVGETLIIQAGRKGKYVGVLGIYPDSEPKLRYQLVALERSDFDDADSMIRLMEQYQQELQQLQIVLTDGISAPHPSGASFVGADRCGECHTDSYEIWQDTKHAHAFETLDPGFKHTGYERLNGVKRTFDPECIACHVAGWDPHSYVRFKSGFLNEEYASTDEEKGLSQLLAGVQCENCHGPGSQHIELVDAGADNPAASVIVTLEQARQNACTKCHDSDNSPNFEFNEYWEKVAH